MRRRRPIARTDGTVRDASLVVIASEDRYAVKQYFELFRSTRVQFRVLETDDCRSIADQIRDFVGSYNKTRIYDLPITTEQVQDAIRRSSARPDQPEIPLAPHTVVHRILEPLIARLRIPD